MLQLNIKLNTINFPNNFVSANDTLRVSVTTIPDNQKQAIVFDVKKLNDFQPSFNLKYSEKTQAIVVCFRKKEFFSSGQMIASTCIQSKELQGLSTTFNVHRLNVNLFEPLQTETNNADHKSNKERKVVGSMSVSFQVKEQFKVKNYGYNLDNIQQRTLRKKMNIYTSNKKNTEYIFN